MRLHLLSDSDCGIKQWRPTHREIMGLVDGAIVNTVHLTSAQTQHSTGYVSLY